MRKKTAVAIALAVSSLGAGPSGAQDISDRVIRWGHLNNTDHPISLAVRKFTEVVAQKSGGKLKVREFPASQLGNELQQQSALRGGTQEVLSTSTGSLAGIVKEFGLLDFPFNVTTPEESDALVDGPFGTALLNKLLEKDLVGLVYWDLGFRKVTNSRRPITKIDDVAGLKLRVIPNPVFVETFKTLGANPVPMAFSEVYTALESKAIDGQENPLSVITSSKLYEVQKYVSGTNHAYTTPIVLLSKKFWDKLSPAEQKIMREAAVESREYQRRVNREQNAQAVAELKAKGMQYNDLTAAELARMRERTRPVAERFVGEYDPDTVKLFRTELDRIQQQK